MKLNNPEETLEEEALETSLFNLQLRDQLKNDLRRIGLTSHTTCLTTNANRLLTVLGQMYTDGHTSNLQCIHISEQRLVTKHGQENPNIGEDVETLMRLGYVGNDWQMGLYLTKKTLLYLKHRN